MTKMFRVSEAANLALHSMAILAASQDRLVQTKEIASVLKASEAHLAKILLVLHRAGLVHATRGPAGGFKLTGDAAKVSLKEIYEAVEGPIVIEKCIFSVPVCNGKKCELGDFFQSVNRKVAMKLAETKLSQISLKARS